MVYKVVKGKLIIALLSAMIILVFLLVHSNHVMVEYINPEVDSREKFSNQFLTNEEIEQEMRKKNVQEICRKNLISQKQATVNPQQFTDILVDDKHKLLYCSVPKVACTNWKRILYILSVKNNSTNPVNINASFVHSTDFTKHVRLLSSYSVSEISNKLENYFKIMFVREPLERLLSAYRNKFTMPYNRYFHKRYGRKIVKMFRKNPNQTSLAEGNDVQFKEFVQYVLNPKEPLNQHWKQYYKLCHPCIVNYDIIGKYETLYRDSIYALQRAGISHKVTFPTSAYHHRKTSDLALEIYRQLPEETIHKLWQLYSVDYTMFGYSYPDYHSTGQTI